MSLRRGGDVMPCPQGRIAPAIGSFHGNPRRPIQVDLEQTGWPFELVFRDLYRRGGSAIPWGDTHVCRIGDVNDVLAIRRPLTINIPFRTLGNPDGDPTRHGNAPQVSA